MKFFWAIVTYLAMGFILCAGVLQAVHGSFWLLIVSFFGYVILLGRLGCLPAASEDRPHASPH